MEFRGTTICAGLGVDGMRVLREIETGLPTCQSVKAPYYELVLKSGSFGSPEFIEKAIRVLREDADNSKEES